MGNCCAVESLPSQAANGRQRHQLLTSDINYKKSSSSRMPPPPPPPDMSCINNNNIISVNRVVSVDDVVSNLPSRRPADDDHHVIDQKHAEEEEKDQMMTGGGLQQEQGSMKMMKKKKLKEFTYGELRSATRNFRPDTVLGEGGFGRVFKGWVDPITYAPSKPGHGIPVAVKKSNPDSDQGLSEWQAEINFLGELGHPNLVKLLGYCLEDTELLLVYEYLQRGSLESHLFRKGAETLAWETRLKIAIGAATGLAFLHTTGSKQVIYRDFKASNILLDSEFNAKLSDFGLAKLGPLNGNSHVTTRVVGTYGYAAPEYMATGHLYVKSDVYGFGVVLLEILTGLRVLDLNRPSAEHNLIDWAKPLLLDKRKLIKRVMDPELDGQYPSRGAFQIAELILKCLEPDPKKRPSMEQVRETLQQISTIKMKPKDAKAAVAAQQQKAAADQHGPANNRHYQTSHRSPLHTKHSSCNEIGGRTHEKKLPGKYSY